MYDVRSSEYIQIYKSIVIVISIWLKINTVGTVPVETLVRQVFAELTDNPDPFS